MTSEDIRDLPYEEANVRLGELVEEGLLSRQEGWKLINQHIDYHEPGAVIERLKAEVESLRAQLEAVTGERDEALADIKSLEAGIDAQDQVLTAKYNEAVAYAQRMKLERDEARTSLEQANIGDKCNAADIVTDEDMDPTKDAFEAVQEWQAR